MKLTLKPVKSERNASSFIFYLCFTDIQTVFRKHRHYLCRSVCGCYYFRRIFMEIQLIIPPIIPAAMHITSVVMICTESEPMPRFKRSEPMSRIRK